MMLRILALDVGDKTCGVAISDELLITAQPVTTLRYKNLAERKRVFEELAKTITDKNVGTVVVGFPLNMNGTEGPQAGKVREFIGALQNYFIKKNKNHENIAWISWDERLSTSGAERSLITADVSRSKRKDVIDKMAAVFILQGYLAGVARS